MIRRLMLLVAIGTAIASCSPRAEQPILGEFFHASRLRDRTALQKLATVSFDPAVHGMITNFAITSVDARHDGGRTVKTVAISAPVKLLGGQVVQKNLIVTLERTGERWIVTSITGAPAAPSTPRS